jgi:hypothetical protein
VDLVGDAVARPAEVKTITLAGSLQIAVIVGVFEVGLQQVMVNVLGCKLDLNPLDSQGLEFQHCHGACGVLQKSVVNADGYFLTRHQETFNQVVGKNLAGQVHREFLKILKGLALLISNLKPKVAV